MKLDKKEPEGSEKISAKTVKRVKLLKEGIKQNANVSVFVYQALELKCKG